MKYSKGEKQNFHYMANHGFDMISEHFVGKYAVLNVCFFSLLL